MIFLYNYRFIISYIIKISSVASAALSVYKYLKNKPIVNLSIFN
jgi:hypothetical protein